MLKNIRVYSGRGIFLLAEQLLGSQERLFNLELNFR